MLNIFVEGNDTKESPIQRITLLEDAYILYNVLTIEECNSLISQSEGMEWESLDWKYPIPFRKNDRIMGKNINVAELIWKRVEPILADISVTVNKGEHKLGSPRGLWKPIGLNPKWRICKYTPGGMFGPHYDGCYVVEENIRSLFTFMLYLNSGYSGGNTQFLYDEMKGNYTPGTEDKQVETTVKQVIATVNPQPGMAIVFLQNMLHEGNPLENGVKYIMRTDIMFNRVEKFDDGKEKSEEEALRLLHMAEDLERSGQMDKATQYYKRAFQMSKKLADEYGY